MVSHAQELKIEPGDHVAIIGNALADRMQHDGWLETLIQVRYPDHELVFRNLGFAGDEVTTRLRSAGFGSPHEWLSKTEADVVIACFGYNESFAGADGIEKFRGDLEAFVKETLAQSYNGESSPQLVLVSPIAHEDLEDPNLPGGSENNNRLAMYTEAIREVALANDVVFADIFHPTQKLYAQMEEPLTINGVHLNELGNRHVARELTDSLFSADPGLEVSDDRIQSVRAAVQDKNFYWFHRYRTTDGYSVYGGRSHLKFVDGQTNREVAQREMLILDEMTANRDPAVWAAARGELYTVDDSKTSEFIPVVTNKPGAGENGAHLFLSGEDAIDLMTVHDGMQVNLFASEEQFPELASPVQMAFDTKGRLWVAAWPSYPHWKPRDEMNDKLLIFEDTDGDGRADVCKTFAERLHNPTGFEFWGNGVLVAQAPDLMFLQDTDGDDIADVRTRVLHGLDSADTHHTANSFTLDPGGALYFQEGVFHHTQVESPWGPAERCVNAGVFRFEPRTRKFDVYVSYGFANPHGHVFDYWGQDFVTDGTGNVNYFAAAFSGRIDYPQKHPGMQPYFKQRVRPCAATEILSSSHFPDGLQGNLLNCNVIGFQGILQYQFEEQDSGFTAVEVEPIVFSSDPNFRPVDVEIGADGAIYFVDWQNPIIGHMQHNLRDPSRDKEHGRVYRVTSTTRPLLTPPRIAGAGIPQLLDLLKSHEGRVRYRAKIELSGRPSADVQAAVNPWLARLDKSDPDYEHHRLEALWLHQHHNLVNEDLLQQVLRCPEPRARAAATRVLCYQRDGIPDALDLLAVQAEDEHPRVRLEAVRVCSFFREARAAEIALLSRKHPTDYYLDYTLTETMRQLEPYWKSAIESGESFATDNPAGIDYLLQNVTTAELVKLPRTEMVYVALLSRDQIVHDYRHEALMGLADLHGSDMLTELVAAIERADGNDSPAGTAVLNDLAHMLTGRPPADLQSMRDRIAALATSARRPLTRQVAYVALMTADGSLDAVWDEASSEIASLGDVLAAVPLIPDAKLRAAAHDRVRPLIHELPADLASAGKDLKGSSGRYLRIELPRKGTLTLAEVQVESGGTNIAPQGTASQSSVSHGGDPKRAIDGNTSGSYGDGGQTHTRENEDNPWWELDLQQERPVEAITVWNRTEGGGQLGKRLEGFTITLLDSARSVVWQEQNVPAPAENVRFELEGDPTGSIRRAAINAIVATGTEQPETFATLAAFIKDDDLRATAVRAISRIPNAHWPQPEIRPLIQTILDFVGALPADERTAPAVRDALQLGNDLAAVLPAEQAQATRKALRELGVPVIVLRPVPHRMIYDKSDLYVEAGRPVEIVLDNIDIMPHNLLVVAPGSIEKVGIAAEKMATSSNAFEKGFAPDLPEVLHKMPLLQPRQTARLNFTAPTEPGDYGYVCTFPGHWRRMYGTLHVVKNLDDVPAELLAASSNQQSTGDVREFVRAWKVIDLERDLEHIGHGTDLERGKALFTAMACVKCHKMKGQGGNVGPDLVGISQKLGEGKIKPVDILTEMVEPSKVIDDKYRTHVIALLSGKVVSGLIVEETDDQLTVRTNPLEAGGEEPLVIKTDDIDERLPSRVSLMPQGLLNTMSREEILDLLGYIIRGEE